MQRPIRTIVSAAVAAMIVNTAATAGSFSLYTESSAAAIGNYAAGIAAEAADASTGWYNPAGLSLLHRTQGVFGLVAIAPYAEIAGFSRFSTQSTPPIPPYQQQFTGIKGARMGYVPTFHVALPVGPNTTVGVSMVSPFGLSTYWPENGPVRYEATTSKLLTTNFSPEIGSRFSEHFAVGAGIDLQYARVKFNRMLGSPDAMVAARLPATFLDSLSYNKGTSFGVGFHAGLMALFNADHTRIGLNYESQVRHHFTGYSILSGRLANLSPTVTPASLLATSPVASFRNNDLASNNIILPDVTTLSAYQDINNKLALLGSVVYTGWNSLQQLELKRVAAFAPRVGQIIINSESTLNYRNTWRAAVGANYHVNERLMLRVGGGYDQTPTNDEFRDIRIPDTNRWAASVGAHYQVKPNIGIDVGYTHLFSAENTRINRSDVAGSASTYRVNSNIKAYADLFGIQAVWTLDEPMVMVMPTK